MVFRFSGGNTKLTNTSRLVLFILHSPNIIRAIKSGRMRWTGHVRCGTYGKMAVA